MKKQSPDQYLKYLAALSLTVATPAVASDANTQAQDTQVTTEASSKNLTTLASSMPDPTVIIADDGCTGWPESTYVRRTASPSVNLQTQSEEAHVSLSALMDDVLGKL